MLAKYPLYLDHYLVSSAISNNPALRDLSNHSFNSTRMHGVEQERAQMEYEQTQNALRYLQNNDFNALALIPVALVSVALVNFVINDRFIDHLVNFGISNDFAALVKRCSAKDQKNINQRIFRYVDDNLIDLCKSTAARSNPDNIRSILCYCKDEIDVNKRDAVSGATVLDSLIETSNISALNELLDYKNLELTEKDFAAINSFVSAVSINDDKDHAAQLHEGKFDDVKSELRFTKDEISSLRKKILVRENAYYSNSLVQSTSIDAQSDLRNSDADIAVAKHIKQKEKYSEVVKGKKKDHFENQELERRRNQTHNIEIG